MQTILDLIVDVLSQPAILVALIAFIGHRLSCTEKASVSSDIRNN